MCIDNYTFSTAGMNKLKKLKKNYSPVFGIYTVILLMNVFLFFPYLRVMIRS